jgi:ABC-type phosphonate transport system ATPase subunit
MPHSRIVIGLVLLVSLALLSAGCTLPVNIPVPATQETQATSVPSATIPVPGEFPGLYDRSAGEIATLLQAVNGNMFTASGAAYSPARLNLAARDLRDSAERYHTVMIGIKKFDSKNDELKRNQYLTYLNGMVSAGNNIGDAAVAEGNNQYSLAMNYAELAKKALVNIEGVPDRRSQDIIVTTKVYLDDYIQRMREKIKA